ncbi:penicillin acylase family protein [Alloalcanivorax xenomutans]|uniref:penicillin acylase family protein n=1 Tax=Alloalcanivorax xenomutans TaxID=1094342 RepID=UPI003C37D465
MPFPDFSVHYRGGLSAACVLSVAVALSGCGSDSSSNRSSISYNATIERTTQGIPHISADDYRGLGYGHGYAIAEDNLCVLADAYVTFRGERSRYFGPDEPAAVMGTFGSPSNLEADFFFRFVVNDQQVEDFMAEQPQEMRELSDGFAVGYNRYLNEIQAGQHAGRHADCRDAEWLGEIDEKAVFRRLVALNLAASSANWVEEITAAAPPSAAPLRLRNPSPESGSEIDLDPERFQLGRQFGIGSNTYAFGGEATQNGRSLNFANPHWYLEGVDRFYQMHMTLPGKLDVAGVSIMGAPMVLLGFNNNVSWSHTVSTARRFTLYRLALKDGDPTTYIKDGAEQPLQEETITVQVLQEDGSLAPVSRTLYRSEYGPMINLSSLHPALAWDTNQAFTLRDVNLENTRSFKNFFAFGHAGSLDEFVASIKRYVGIPWVNTSAIGRDDERALYSDITAVPNVPDSMLAGCLVPTLGPVILQAVPGLPLLDGSRSECDWKTDSDSAAPGTFGPANLPVLLTTDYIANMNDSYWLSNPDQPLTGYAGIMGQEDYEQSLRTRMGHMMVEDRKAGTDGHGMAGASSETVREMVLNSRNLSAELLKAEVLPLVCPGDTADEAEACIVLDNWDNTGNLDAAGAHIWSAFWLKIRNQDELYANPFNAEDPIHTPNGLNTGNADVVAAVEAAFSEAVQEVVDSGVALNAKVRDWQKYAKTGTDIPQFGGEGYEGYFTVLRNTYMHVVDFPEGEPVRAYTMLTHAVTTDPASPYYSEATEDYSEKTWLEFPFTEEQIKQQSISITELSQ